MLDLEKYLRQAAADPSFKEKLLQDANQAIKDEFGEELPYKLKCKEKLSFEIKAIESLSDAGASNVAGGTNQENTGAPNPPYGVPGRPLYGYGVPGLPPYSIPPRYDGPPSYDGNTQYNAPPRCWIPPVKF